MVGLIDLMFDFNLRNIFGEFNYEICLGGKHVYQPITEYTPPGPKRGQIIEGECKKCGKLYERSLSPTERVKYNNFILNGI